MTDVPIPDPPPEPPVIDDKFHNQVFTHSSATSTANPKSYESLASFGSPTLHAVVSRILFEWQGGEKLDRGQLEKIRKKCVAVDTVQAWAKAYNFRDCIQVASHLGWAENDNIPREAFYAYLAAIWLTLSIDQVTDFVRQLVEPILAGATERPVDPLIVTKLQNKLNRLALGNPVFEIDEDKSAGLEERFVVHCKIADIYLGKGVGRGKKLATRKAAEVAYNINDRQLSLKARKVTEGCSEA